MPDDSFYCVPPVTRAERVVVRTFQTKKKIHLTASGFNEHPTISRSRLQAYHYPRVYNAFSRQKITLKICILFENVIYDYVSLLTPTCYGQTSTPESLAQPPLNPHLLACTALQVFLLCVHAEYPWNRRDTACLK